VVRGPCAPEHVLWWGFGLSALLRGRDLHSATLQLNLSAFCVTGVASGVVGGGRGY